MSKSPRPDHADDNKIKKKKRGTVLNFVLLVMLVVGLGGYGVTQFGGSIKSAGTVGGKDIPLDAYARELQGQIAALQQQFGGKVPSELVQTLGLEGQALSRVVNATGLAAEADRLGLSVGDASVKEVLKSNPNFAAADGSFDPTAYEAILKQNGLKPKDFEQRLREEAARGLLMQAVRGGLVAPQGAAQVLTAYAEETRAVSWLPLSEASLATPPGAPDEAALAKWHQDHIADYTRPEGKRLRYVGLLAEKAGASAPIPEEDVKALYDKRIDQYKIPERRLVERLVYPDQAAADAAKARLDAGTPFETLVTERGLTLEAIDLGDVAKVDLGAAGEAVFALAGPGVAGPLNSDLGPALFRVNAILPAQETTLDAARADLEKELRLEAGAKLIGDQIEAMDDLLAGGGSLEDLAKLVGGTVETTDYAPGAEDNFAFAAYGKFAKPAADLTKDSFAEVTILDDGSMIAMEMVEALPPAPLPLDKVRDKVLAAVQADLVTKALMAEAEALRTKLQGGADLASLGAATIEPALRRGTPLAGAPAEVSERAFAMEAGAIEVVAAAGQVGLLRLDAITPADLAAEAVKETQALTEKAYRDAMAGDVEALYMKAIVEAAGVKLDQAAINAVNSQVLTR